ncbi:hypothetical protein [Arthrobacter sp. GMC3]|uniref:hypothetical protein n=1 Tax=Arthrobacter sp. GMC3 TaxID=2058894 RepID=UPI000CE56260|nr:hypothetical protein [Arthrobacter sp. GMC3]
MSQRASRIAPATVGNNARALAYSSAEPDFDGGLPLPLKESKAPRTPLALVSFTPTKNKTPLVVLFLLLVGALAAVLIMSVSVSQGQYELVGLKAQQTELANANQAHELELVTNEAPQSLVARAAAMGMVPAGTTGQIDVRTQKVTGNPTPAKADTKGLVSIPPAEVNKPIKVPVESPAATVAKDQKSLAKDTPPAPVVPVEVAPDLNGGTIPAPGQKTN